MSTDSCPNCGVSGHRADATRAFMAGKPLGSSCATCQGAPPDSRSSQFGAGAAHSDIGSLELIGGMTVDQDYKRERADTDD